MFYFAPGALYREVGSISKLEGMGTLIKNRATFSKILKGYFLQKSEFFEKLGTYSGSSTILKNFIKLNLG